MQQILDLIGKGAFIRPRPMGLRFLLVVTLDNLADRMANVPATNLSSVCLINCRW
jgi:hypothetical protein